MALASASGARAAEWPSEWKAVYRIAFGGVSIGKFRIAMNTPGQGYKLDANAKLSIFLGAIKWRGVVRASGVIVNQDLEPAAYVMEFKNNSQDGSVKIAFAESKVTSYEAKPPKSVSRHAIPLEPKHLEKVLDPLSAFVATTVPATKAKDPCTRTLAIFNGRQRFDLVYRPKKNGDGAATFTCAIRYVPVAGHKMNEETKAMAETEGIEAKFRRVPGDGAALPEEVTVPTGWGTVVLTAEQVDVVTHDGKDVALIKDE